MCSGVYTRAVSMLTYPQFREWATSLSVYYRELKEAPSLFLFLLTMTTSVYLKHLYNYIQVVHLKQGFNFNPRLYSGC